MSDIISCLYQYAQENRIGAYLYCNREYNHALRKSGEAFQTLQARLDEPGRGLLSDLLNRRTALHTLELEAIFACGLSFGLELSAPRQLPG